MAKEQSKVRKLLIDVKCIEYLRSDQHCRNHERYRSNRYIVS